MPIVLIRTNLAKAAVPKDFLLSTSKLLSAAIGKPLDKFLLNIKTDEAMMRGGDSSPCLFAHLTSIGKVGPAENGAYASQLCQHFEKELGIPQHRCVIRFDDVAPHQIGNDGKLMG